MKCKIKHLNPLVLIFVGVFLFFVEKMNGIGSKGGLNNDISKK
jgi:hypothetical protein